jgi:hypothetical protein
MTAKDELRSMLDERGTGHTDLGGMTEWTGAGGRICRAYTRNEPLTVDVAMLAVPPEQAIAATLGGGKLTAEQVRECVGTVYLEGYSDGSVNRGAHIDETDWQAVADELNEMLGSGECIPHGEWERVSQTQEVRHVFCDCGYELGMDRRDSFPFERTQLFAMPNFCQECGRRIRKAVTR